MEEKIKQINILVEEIVDDIQNSSTTYADAIDKISDLALSNILEDSLLNDLIYSRLHERMVQEKPTIKSRLES